MKKQISSLDNHIKLATIIYQFELFDKKISLRQIDTKAFDENSLAKLKKIILNYSKYKKMISKFLLESWSWERVNPLLRSIIILGVSELKKDNKSLIINRMINITKIFFFDESYKLVNSLLDNVAKKFI